VTGSISSAPGHAVRESVRGPQHEQTIAPGSSYWMELRLVPDDQAAATIPLRGGFIEVAAPADFHASGQRAFSIHWVDFYR